MQQYADQSAHIALQDHKKNIRIVELENETQQ